MARRTPSPRILPIQVETALGLNDMCVVIEVREVLLVFECAQEHVVRDVRVALGVGPERRFARRDATISCMACNKPRPSRNSVCCAASPPTTKASRSPAARARLSKSRRCDRSRADRCGMTACPREASHSASVSVASAPWLGEAVTVTVEPGGSAPALSRRSSMESTRTSRRALVCAARSAPSPTAPRVAVRCATIPSRRALPLHLRLTHADHSARAVAMAARSWLSTLTPCPDTSRGTSRWGCTPTPSTTAPLHMNQAVAGNLST